MKRFLPCIILLLSLPGLSLWSHSQVLTNAEKPLFVPPNLYVAFHNNEKITIDGKLSEPAWQKASWSGDFVDIEGSTQPKRLYNTAMKMLWSDSCLYVAARLQEPHLWATLHQQDAVIFQDNDFELFIDPYNTTQPYFEIEVNALNTIFDLLLPKPYRNGGSAMIGYNVAGLQSAVQMQGTLNYREDMDSGWTVEMAIPFAAISLGNEVHVPRNNEQWRINFSRVEWEMETTGSTYSKKKIAKVAICRSITGYGVRKE